MSISHFTSHSNWQVRDDDQGRELRSEAQYLYGCFFDDYANETLVERYEMAHHHYGRTEILEERQMMNKMRLLRLDAEAIEYVLRLKNRKNVLTRKVQIIHFLAECEPCRSRDFLNFHNMGLRVWLPLFGAIYHTVRCFVKGHILVKGYGLA